MHSYSCAWALVLAAVLALSSPASASGNAPPVTDRSTALVVDTCKGVADGAHCTDQNPCTLDDACVAETCVGTPAADGSACTDGNQCTMGDRCQAGICKGAPVADGTTCTDGEPCTDPDSCVLGRCAPGPALVCDDGDMCTKDTCVPGDGCHYDVIVSCSDAAVDATPPDAAPPIDGGPDADAEIVDGSDDVPLDAGFDAVGGEDALDDAGADDAPKIYEARGGACVCSAGEAPRAATGFGALVAAGALFYRRKRRRSEG